MTNQPLPPELTRAVTRFAKRLRAKHAALGGNDIDRRTADQLARLLRTVLVPRRKPGRKPTSRVLAAVRMRSDKIPWPEIYNTLIEGFSSLPFYERMWQARKLRRAVAARVKRRT